MGLLKKVNDFTGNKKSNYVGLLKKSLQLSLNHGLDFFQFSQKYKIPFFAELKKINGNYVINNSYGFDGVSILSSISSPDFWNGTIKEKHKWYEFSAKRNNLLPFYQFFSFNQKDYINYVYIYYCDNDTILMICETDENEAVYCNEIIEDYRKIEYSPKLDLNDFKRQKTDIITKYTIDFTDSVNQFLTQHSANETYLEHFKKVFDNQIHLMLLQNFSRPDFVSRKEKFIYNALIFSKSPVDDELIQFHIKKSFEEMLESCSQAVTITCKGNASSYLEIQDFLQEK
ncbi:MAG: hypothetical protein IKX23_07815 [Treponema sp.]|nr:hypothetical protein [Treponema sp.]